MAPWTKVSPADLFTIANGVLGFVAITYILDSKFLAATGLLLLSMVMDGLDGYIARKFGSKHSRGQVLDSISDSISFAFAPALLIYAEFHNPDSSFAENVISQICAISILATGLFRLARFSAGGYQLSYFVGMPAPAAALVILLLCLLFGTQDGAEGPSYYFTFGVVSPLVLGLGFLVSFLMASEIAYPKPHGKMALATGIGLLLALLPFVAGLALLSNQSLYTAFSRTATSIALALALVYVFGGPVYEKLKGSRS
ncbi:MAG: CDP-diacylglycerol--serine O-phosphatidyltransferase [Euryarchaeota archaeon RBG_13_57_23]|nr:MAG: CDP-diacylglycerol--serine O-phosphatidyltransferase [Euryarchaeota archaeon RBG_13_57_23]